MLTNLKIQNFKSHKNTNLVLRPLTLLTGTNSSGKTSVLQSLLLLRQSYMLNVLTEGAQLDGYLCDIGTASDALCKTADSDVLSFTIKTDEGECINFRFNTENCYGDDTFIPLHSTGANDIPHRLDSLNLFSKDFQYLSGSRWSGRSWYPKVSSIAGEQRQISFSYGKGEQIASFLYLHWGEEPIINSRGNEETYLLEETVYWMDLISPGLRMDIEVCDNGKYYSINYYTYNSSQDIIVKISADNIGLGVSYSLPVIVTLLSAKPGSLIIIENPETFLHPSSQSHLAHLISKVVAKGVQVIIETHSDHIVNGTLVNIKQTTIPASAVMIHYLDLSDKDLSSIHYQLVPETDGHLGDVPKGFFDQFDHDLNILVD